MLHTSAIEIATIAPATIVPRSGDAHLGYVSAMPRTAATRLFELTGRWHREPRSVKLDRGLPRRSAVVAGLSSMRHPGPRAPPALALGERGSVATNPPRKHALDDERGALPQRPAGAGVSRPSVGVLGDRPTQASRWLRGGRLLSALSRTPRPIPAARRVTRIMRSGLVDQL